MTSGDTRGSTIATSQRWQRLVPLVFVTYSLVADRPRDAAWLDESELRDIEGRLAAEQADLEPVQGGLGNGADYAFMAVTLFLSALLMFAVRTHGRPGVDLASRREVRAG